MTVFIPLNGGEGDDRKRPKSSESGWQLRDYTGAIILLNDTWYGMRLDDWIVVDCDSDEAMKAWLAHINRDYVDHTWVRKTPHGWHFFYNRTQANLRVVAQKWEKTDLKLGMGHYVVYLGDGYYDWDGSTVDDAIDFDPAWAPQQQRGANVAEWSEMPDGMGDNAMTAFAGTFRRWGMDAETIAACLEHINEEVMTEAPMPPKSIRRIARSVSKHDPEAHRTVMCPKCENEVTIV